jgi:tetratricopeptide (TPR) repeat protein
MLSWLEELLPVLDKLPPAARQQWRPEWLRLYLLLVLRSEDPDRAEGQVRMAIAPLEHDDRLKLLGELGDSVPQAKPVLEGISEHLSAEFEEGHRRRVQTELQTARLSGRPLRYSVGAVRPGLHVGGNGESARRATLPARRSLALARQKRAGGDLTGAIRDLQLAVEQGSSDPEVRIELAECFTEGGEYDLARRLYVDTLRQLESTQGDVELRLRGLYSLATVIEHLDSPAEAMHHLEQLLIIRHDYRDSRDRLQKLKRNLTPVASSNGNHEPVAPSQVAANVILDEILGMLAGKGPDAPGDGS